jgi:hypothetical protein
LTAGSCTGGSTLAYGPPNAPTLAPVPTSSYAGLVSPQLATSPLAVLLMSVAGSGKTVLGVRLLEKLGVHFLDGDHFHPQRNLGSGVDLS